MNMQDALVSAIKKTFVYKGRASRSEFWYFRLCYIFFLVVFVMAITANSTLFTCLGGLALLLFFIADISLTVRRFHDINISGWWVVPIILISLVGLGVIGIIPTIIKGTTGPNKYGADPLTPNNL